VSGTIRCAVVLLAFGVVGARAVSAAPTPTPAPHEARYRLTWAAGDVTPTADNAAWEVTTNLGYRVRVTRGWVTSYGMELVECPRSASAADELLWLVTPTTAWAGHMSGTPNPAAIRPIVVESLMDGAARDAGTVTLAPQAYCKIHYLVARASGDSAGMPAGVDMADTSLYVEGSYRAPGATIDASFALRTGSAYGQLFERVGNPPHPMLVDTGLHALDVEIRRRRSRLFDGVDFNKMPVKSAGLRALQALVDGTEVAVVAVDAKR
jgi:hypothetical protein